MNPIRRELLNGLFVLVVASLLSVAFAAFQVSFNVLLWTLVLLGVAVAVSGYVLFEITLGYLASTDAREKAWVESTEQRELEWLKRVGKPARLELGMVEGGAGMRLLLETAKNMNPASDYTGMLWVDREGAKSVVSDVIRDQLYPVIMERLKHGTIREYKRLLCFDPDVLANDHELKSGILRVGEGPGTINRNLGEHCRTMLQTKGCYLYVAPVVLRSAVTLFGTDKVSMSVDTVDQDTGAREVLGIMLFCDPPNGEIIEQFRQIERETERRMVAVHKIVFPEDAAHLATEATR